MKGGGGVERSALKSGKLRGKRSSEVQDQGRYCHFHNQTSLKYAF